jgi:hypothetical protein
MNNRKLLIAALGLAVAFGGVSAASADVPTALAPATAQASAPAPSRPMVERHQARHERRLARREHRLARHERRLARREHRLARHEHRLAMTSSGRAGKVAQLRPTVETAKPAPRVG